MPAIIATAATTIAEIEKRFISAIVTITEKWFPCDRYDRRTFFLSDRSDHTETRLEVDSPEVSSPGLIKSRFHL